MENVNIIGDLRLMKRRNIGSIVIGILCFLTLTVPLFYLFVPWSWFKISVQAAEGTPFTSGSYTLNAMNLMIYLFTRGDPGVSFIVTNAHVSAQVRDNAMAYYLAVENVYALCGWYILTCLFSLILIIKGLIIILRGRVNNSKAMPVLAFFFALSAGIFLLDTWRLGYYDSYSMQEALKFLGASTDDSSFSYTFWQNYVFAGTAVAIFLFIWIAYLTTMRRRYYEEDVQYVEDVEYTLRAERNGGRVLYNVVNVGGHKYSRNTYIESVSVADGVGSIGVGAFSNCLNLKEVTLPQTLKRIGSNAFFNCPNLRKIQFLGSKTQWLKISRGTNWLAQAGTQSVLCKDGSFRVNQYK